MKTSATPWLLLATLAVTATAAAQAPFTFRFEAGTVLEYDVSQSLVFDMNVNNEPTRVVSEMEQRRRWTVQNVDALGVATLELSFSRLKLSQSMPDGDQIAFDSADPEAGNADMRAKMAKIVNKPVRRVQIAPDGSVKASETLLEEAAGIQGELPFHVVMTGELPSTGLAWKRQFAIPLVAPLGSGNAYPAEQSCTLAQATPDRLEVRIDTVLVERVENGRDRLALMQFLPKGTVVLDPRRGVMLSAQIAVDEQLADVDGKGGTCRVRQTVNETLVEPVAQQADRRN